jgi:hypothetical protein
MDRRALGHSGALTGSWSPATLGHESSPARMQKRQGSAGNPSQASLELRQWCGGRVMVMKWDNNGARWRRCLSSEGGENEWRMCGE